MKKRSFNDFFDDYGILLIVLLVSLITISCCILFTSYETTFTLYVDGNTYECDYFVLNDDFIEIHYNCSSEFFSSHSKYCSFYKIPFSESYSVVTHEKTVWNDWFGY